MCGYPIKSDEAISSGVGGGCRHKPKGSITRWQKKVKRTISYQRQEPISLDGGKSNWVKVECGWVQENHIVTDTNTGNHIVTDSVFHHMLEMNGLILKDGEVDVELFDRVKGDIDGFFSGEIE
jgi:hypothetical protein